MPPADEPVHLSPCGVNHHCYRSGWPCPTCGVPSPRDGELP
jgi:hypothetical protein